MPIPLFQVDAFADGPFRGNPAAVCLMDRDAPDSWLQSLAAENNLSETAYLWPMPGKEYRLRWFTPATEVDLCGHATLASAHVLWQEGLLGPFEEATFHTRSGALIASRKSGWIHLDFPDERALPIASEEVHPELLPALGLPHVKKVARNRFDYLVEADSAAQVRELDPDFRTLKRVTTRGIIVTALSDDPAFDFVSRFFAPAEDIDEDPVTGSAHCALAPWWGERLHKTVLTACQVSKRGGIVKMELESDRVYLGGKAVTIFRGTIAPEAEPPAV
ncbi:MAG: hypothetical protein PWP23_47 [Candidatus Sumerlaeota bacterium]|nr:hypothetical protein [Candidatus Sumerlaeota bacterium]